MYIEDLSPYPFPSLAHLPLLAVGWLDGKHNFQRGSPPRNLLIGLENYIKYSIVQTLGRHKCNICPEDHFFDITLPNCPPLNLGSSEFIVFSPNGDRAYIAPNLIYHYTHDCEYLPPQEFLDGILNGPSPGSQKYLDYCFHWFKDVSVWLHNDLTGEMVFRS